MSDQQQEGDAKVDVKQAVRSAIDYVTGLYNPMEIHDLALEEVELSNDERYWYITLGFTRKKQLPLSLASQLSAFGRGDAERVYKVITVRTNDGKPVSMKIRQVQPA